MQFTAVLVSSFLIPVLGLVIGSMRPPWVRARRPRNAPAFGPKGWSKARFASLALYIAFLGLSGFVSYSLLQDVSARNAEVDHHIFQSKTAELIRQVDDQWMRVVPQLQKSSLAFDERKLRDEQVPANAEAAIIILSNGVTSFTAHRLIVAALKADLSDGEMLATGDHMVQVQRQLQLAIDSHNLGAMRDLLRSTWIEIPPIFQRSQRLFVMSLHQMRSREEAAFRADPTGWQPPLSIEELDRLMYGTRSSDANEVLASEPAPK